MGRRRRAIAYLAAYVVVAVADVAAELADHGLLIRLLPVLLMPLLAGYLWEAGPRTTVSRWVLLALAFSWLGDVFGQPLVVKIAFFLVTQIAYALAFRPHWRSSVLGRAGPRTAYAVGLSALILVVSNRAGDLGLAVLVYGVSLALMLGLATGVSRSVAVGAVLFLVSDLLLAYGAFVDPPADPLVGAGVMATYLPAQLLLVLGTRRVAAAVPAAAGRTAAARR